MSQNNNETALEGLIDRAAEREVIGTCLVRPSEMAQVIDEIALEAGDFHVQRHALIWGAMVRLYELGIDIDVGTVREVLVDAGTFERVGMQGLSETLDGHGYGWNGVFFARKLKRLAIQRRTLAEQNTLAMSIAQSDHEGVGQSLTRITALRDEAIRLDTDEAAPSWADEVADAVDASLDPRPLDLIPMGLGFLDQHIGGGAERGWLMVVMGPAKSGKSALAVNTMAVSAAKAGKQVLVMSLEMSKRDNVRRFLARESGVPTRAMRNGDLSDYQRIALTEAGDAVARWPMEVKTSASTIDDIAALARKHKAEKGLDVLVVDYIQLIDNGIQNMAQDVAKTTRGLKRLAVSLECVVIALSQPNNEDAKTGEVGLFSGKGSGAIAADCDAMLVPLRDGDDHQRAGLNLAGFRHGDPHKWPLGSLVFDGGRMVFREPGVVWRIPKRDPAEVMS